MEKEVVFLASEDGDLSLGKLFVFGLNVLFAIASYQSCKILSLGIIIIFPIFIISLIVSICYIVKTLRGDTFELLSFFLLPVLVACIISIGVGAAKSQKIEKNLLEAQRYVEDYYKLSGSFPLNDDPYLKELDADIFGGEDYYELHANGARIRRGDDKVYFYPRP
ncbi:MAG: hypothetical protein J6Y60_10775 [Treponema sp.]|nr:hypothetical protein [Treponema sp.]